MVKLSKYTICALHTHKFTAREREGEKAQDIKVVTLTFSRGAVEEKQFHPDVYDNRDFVYTWSLKLDVCIWKQSRVTRAIERAGFDFKNLAWINSAYNSEIIDSFDRRFSTWSYYAMFKNILDGESNDTESGDCEKNKLPRLDL